jgi:D-hexose-6-phosphate mutarotase
MIVQDRIALKKGHGNLPYFELRFNGAEAHVYLHGAHVLHYQPAGQAPVLWQSKSSHFEPGKPIRGGIPVCWPWFGPHPEDPSQPLHGVARLVEWEPVQSAATGKSTSITLKLPDSAYPDASLQLTVELSDHLGVTLTTTNKRDTELKVTKALHSYFSIQNIHDVTVTGLEGQRYINKLLPDKSLQTQTGPISFAGETEHVYTNTPHDCSVIDKARKRRIHIRKKNSLSTVVWNPWVEKAARMPDFGNEEFREMVCVETANICSDCIVLPPGQKHAMHLQIQAQPI